MLHSVCTIEIAIDQELAGGKLSPHLAGHDGDFTRPNNEVRNDDSFPIDRIEEVTTGSSHLFLDTHLSIFGHRSRLGILTGKEDASLVSKLQRMPIGDVDSTPEPLEREDREQGYPDQAKQKTDC